MRDFIPPESCWRLIGAGGDRSCPELLRVVHCRNCEVLTRAAEAFLERPSPAGYAEFFTRIVAEPPRPAVEEVSVVLFRLGQEWMAIDTAVFCEVADLRPVHRIAHRVGTLVSGLVNIRGQLHLCVALDRLLEIPLHAGPAAESRKRERLAVIGTRAETWVFAVSEVHGVHRFAESSLEAAPATLPASLSAITRGVFPWGERRAAYLNAAELQLALRKVAG